MEVLKSCMGRYDYNSGPSGSVGTLPMTMFFRMEKDIMRIRQNEGPAPDIEWRLHGDELVCRMFGLLGLGVDSEEVRGIVPVELHEVHDDRVNEGFGYSFLRHKNNLVLGELGRRFLVNRIDALQGFLPVIRRLYMNGRITVDTCRDAFSLTEK
ncbi:hypothetical protein SLS53_003038 [Cytospora paraplurivora]|uniref:Uncharacterized protein n=1 Tax=Cytospora paraplurivora TaxID=2898453 RepID=A0AAN9ULI1_9PEZI